MRVKTIAVNVFKAISGEIMLADLLFNSVRPTIMMELAETV